MWAEWAWRHRSWGKQRCAQPATEVAEAAAGDVVAVAGISCPWNKEIATMRRIGVGFAVMLWVCTAWAGGAGAVRKQAEATILITGTIAIAPDGTVSDSTLDFPEKLPPGVVDMVQKQVLVWRFEPIVVDGKPVHAQTKMSLRVVGKKRDDDSVIVGIRSATFGDPRDEPEELRVSSKYMNPPRYPVAAAKSGVSGTVYLLLRVGRDGRVEDAVAEQVNLRVVATEGVMARWRRALGDAARSTAKDWRFAPPTRGELVDEPYWVVRTPVDFFFPGNSPYEYGRWQLYVPGPRETPEWSRDKHSMGSDALADGGVYTSGRPGLRLLTRFDET
jgi:hypothetical protein